MKKKQSKNEKVKTKPMKSLKAAKVGDMNKQQSIDLSKTKVKSPVKKSSPKRKLSSDESTRETTSEVECGDKKTQVKQKSKKSTVATIPSSVKSKTTTTISHQKRKKSKREDVKNHDKNVVTKKRMASLNASAILAASYEIENYAARHESSTSSSSSEGSDDEEESENDVKNEKHQYHQPPTMKKEKKDVKMESEEVFLLLSHLFTFCLFASTNIP